MTKVSGPMIHMPDATSTELLREVLIQLLKKDAERVQVLVDRGQAKATIDKLRVALSRSRERNRTAQRKIAHFTLNHSVYPYTNAEGRRFDALVLSIYKSRRHRALELVDDMLSRGQLQMGASNVA